MLATGSEDDALKLWDLGTGQARTLSKGLIPLGYLPDGNFLAVYCNEGDATVLKLWDVRRDREHARLGRFHRHGLNHGPVAVTADGKALAAVGPEIMVWETATGQARLKLPALQVGMVEFSPDGRFLAFAGLDSGGLRLWDTRPIREVVIRPGR
jgi:WD40 repeat protein